MYWIFFPERFISIFFSLVKTFTNFNLLYEQMCHVFYCFRRSPLKLKHFFPNEFFQESSSQLAREMLLALCLKENLVSFFVKLCLCFILWPYRFRNNVPFLWNIQFSDVFRGYKNETFALRKKCPYSKLFWFIFSHIRTEYGLCISPYSVRMQENMDQNNFKYWHFLCSAG